MADETLHSMTENTAPVLTDELYLLDDPGGSPDDNRLPLRYLLKYITGLSELSGADLATDVIPIHDVDTDTSLKILGRDVGAYTIQFNGITALNPVDATTYYIDLGAHRTTDANARLYIPRTGKILAAYVRFLNAGTGSSETSTVYLRLNSTSDTTISAAVANDVNNKLVSKTDLAVAVSAGDYVSIKWVTPTWATNPTSVTVDGTIFIA